MFGLSGFYCSLDGQHSPPNDPPALLRNSEVSRKTSRARQAAAPTLGSSGLVLNGELQLQP